MWIGRVRSSDVTWDHIVHAPCLTVTAETQLQLNQFAFSHDSKAAEDHCGNGSADGPAQHPRNTYPYLPTAIGHGAIFHCLTQRRLQDILCLPCVTPGIINFAHFLWHRNVFLQPPLKSKIPPSSHLHSALFKAFTQMLSHRLSFQMGVCNSGL